MKADPAILLRLDAPTKAPSWPVGAEGRKNKPPNLLCILGTSFKVVPHIHSMGDPHNTS